MITNVVLIGTRIAISYAMKRGIPFRVWRKVNGKWENMIRIYQSKESHYRANTSVRRKKEIQKSRTLRAAVRDPSRKVNLLSKVIWDRKKYNSSPGLSVPPEYVIQSFWWTLSQTLIDGLVEKTSSFLDEIALKAVNKDKGSDRWKKKK